MYNNVINGIAAQSHINCKICGLSHSKSEQYTVRAKSADTKLGSVKFIKECTYKANVLKAIKM